MMPKFLAQFMIFLFLSVSAVADQLPIFDGHVHYSQNSWETLSPEDVRNRMEKANVRWALVSSSPDAGTLKLKSIMPEKVIPELRPYHGSVNSSNWVESPGIIDYLTQRLSKNSYAGIGEFHLHGTDIYSPEILAKVAELARERNILLHIHAGAEQVRRVFNIAPQITVLWAHAGFEDSTNLIDEMMKAYPKLYTELSFRARDVASGNSVDPEWRALFDTYPNRFIVGTDTYIPSRWQEYETLVEEHRSWLKTLPAPLADNIAWRNAVVLFSVNQNQ